MTLVCFLSMSLWSFSCSFLSLSFSSLFHPFLISPATSKLRLVCRRLNMGPMSTSSLLFSLLLLFFFFFRDLEDMPSSTNTMYFSIFPVKHPFRSFRLEKMSLSCHHVMGNYLRRTNRLHYHQLNSNSNLQLQSHITETSYDATEWLWKQTHAVQIGSAAGFETKS